MQIALALVFFVLFTVFKDDVTFLLGNSPPVVCSFPKKPGLRGSGVVPGPTEVSDTGEQDSVKGSGP